MNYLKSIWKTPFIASAEIIMNEDSLIDQMVQLKKKELNLLEKQLKIKEELLSTHNIEKGIIYI